MVQFPDGLEPVAVYGDGRLGPWLHARVDDVTALSGAQVKELAKWLAGTGIRTDGPGAVVVSHDDNGAYEVHVDGQAYPVEFKSIPGWLQRPAPVTPRKGVKAHP